VWRRTVNRVRLWTAASLERVRRPTAAGVELVPAGNSPPSFPGSETHVGYELRRDL
jgi:hypothetical protein